GSRALIRYSRTRFVSDMASWMPSRNVNTAIFRSIRSNTACRRSFTHPRSAAFLIHQAAVLHLCQLDAQSGQCRPLVSVREHVASGESVVIMGWPAPLAAIFL